MPTLEDLARRICLQNAVQHGGKCEPKGLVGRVMGGHPEFRSDPRAVAAALEAAGAAVNAMGLEAQKAALAAEAPDMLEAQKKEKRTGLKELPNVKGKVVMRFAPNPNGPLSFGHSRGVSLLAEYQRVYDADLILRFDDTDPQVKPPLMDAARGWNGYEMVKADFGWLTGTQPTRIVVASDRIAIYQEAARDLMKAGGGYVCSCDAEAWRGMKERGEPCPHRDASPEANLAAFQAMVDGRTPKGGAVLRVKTDIKHRNVALRDWTAFRVVAADAVHPRERLREIPRHHAWPLLDFQSAIEDHLQGVTHVVRGKDLMDSTRKQTFLYQHMGWMYPETLYWGRVSVHEFGKFSTSIMRRAIEAGKFTGWDDPRLPTLAALRRRGYDPTALRAFWVGLGLTEKDIAVSLANLDAEDAKAVEPKAHRYFFVPDPQPLRVEGIAGREARPLLLPGRPEAGHRVLAAETDVVVAKSDLAPRLRLKDLGNVELAGGLGHFTSHDMDRSLAIVQWLPRSAARPFTVLKPEFVAAEGEAETEEGGADAGPAEIEVPPLHEVRGFVEAAATAEVGRVVQFERFGFVRIEAADRGVWLHA
ncbi:MAG: glutamate--tRNA ligase [Thermoplasmatota archaeon]|nr:glutamate--tRNA ligase [Halobacteriales archaeon]